MPYDPEPLSDAQVDAALRELVGDDLARARVAAGELAPSVAGAHVRRAAHAARGELADVAALDDARARRADRLVRRRRRIGIAAGWAAAGIAVVGGGSTGLAAAEVLPRPAARVIAAAVDAVGLPVPAPVERAAAPVEEAPATTTTEPPAPQLASSADAAEPSHLPSSSPTTNAVPVTAAAAAVSPTSAPRPTVPATTTTTLPPCGTTSSSSSTSSSTTSSTSSTTTTTTTTTVAVGPAGPPCDPPAQGEGVDPGRTSTTSTTAPPPAATTTTTADPGASAEG